MKANISKVVRLKQQKKLGKKINIKPYLFIAPIFILLFMFSAWPLITSAIKSFYRYDALRINEFIGFNNYKNLFFHDKAFWISLRNLLVLFVGMNICFCFPIIVAKMIYSVKSGKFRYALRTIFTLPVVVPSVITMMLWKFIYYPQIGLLSRIADFLGVVAPNMLGNTSTALIAIILIGFPWISGMAFLMIFAALQDIDPAVIEAAKLDGANTIQLFFKVELPSISNQIKALYLIAMIGQFQDYERILILTDGGPNNATLVPGLHMYHLAFPVSGEAEYGYACAIAMILFLVTLVLSKVLMKNKEE